MCQSEIFWGFCATFGLMFVLYGTTRFFIEFIRDGNPFEYGWWAIYKGGTVSQNLGIYMVIIGVTTMVLCFRAKTKCRPGTSSA